MVDQHEVQHKTIVAENPDFQISVNTSETLGNFHLLPNTRVLITVFSHFLACNTNPSIWDKKLLRQQNSMKKQLVQQDTYRVHFLSWGWNQGHIINIGMRQG